MTDRELDCEIAKHMGYTNIVFDKQEDDYVCNLTGDSTYRVPLYSSDMRKAWMVVERFRKGDVVISLLEGDHWYVTFDDIGEVDFSAPRAICLAALKAWEVVG